MITLKSALRLVIKTLPGMNTRMHVYDYLLIAFQCCYYLLVVLPTKDCILFSFILYVLILSVSKQISSYSNILSSRCSCSPVFINLTFSFHILHCLPRQDLHSMNNFLLCSSAAFSPTYYTVPYLNTKRTSKHYNEEPPLSAEFFNG